MKKTITKIISILVAISIVLSFVVVPVSAVGVIGNISTAPIETLDKIICNATIEDNFADDSIIVVLKKDANPAFRTMTQQDFSEIGAESVKCINEYKASVVKNIKQIKNRNTQTASVNSGTTITTLNALSTVTGRSVNELNTMEENFNYIYEIKLKEKGKQNVLDAIKELEKREDVYAVEPNYIFESTDNINNDVYLENYSEQWAIDVLDLPEAWEITTGNPQVYVGVIDSGIDFTNPHFQDNIDLSLSRDFTTERDDIYSDDAGHGTFVAGFIGSANTSGGWIRGVCPNVRLVNLRVSRENDPQTTSRILEAIEYADEMDIPILNISTNAECFGDNDSAIISLTSCINSYKGLIVCAAGNYNEEINPGSTRNQRYYLAGIPSPNIIAVTATDVNDNFVESYCYGPLTVDLAAPGKDLWTATTAFDSQNDDGTSYAAPYVAGVAALLMSVYPKTNDIEWEDYIATIKQAILNSVDEVSTLEDKVVTGGRLNAYSALRYLEGDSYYKIKYDANGGTGVMADTRAFHDTSREIRPLAFTRTGGIFEGWYAKRPYDNKWYYQNSGATQFGWYTDGEQPSGWIKKLFEDCDYVYNLSNVSSSNYEHNTIVFYAQWTPMFTIKYVKNGGTGTMADTTVIYGVNTATRSNQFVYTNHVFDCWHAYRPSVGKWLYKHPTTSSTGWYAEGGQPAGWAKFRYNNGCSVSTTSNVCGDIVEFHAQWKATYTIAYNANGGSGSMQNTTAVVGTTTYLSYSSFYWDGHEFIGWHAKRNSDNKWLYYNSSTAATGWYTEGSQPYGWTKRMYGNHDSVNSLVTLPGETVTLYAQWQECCIIVYDANGGEGYMDDTILYYGGTIQLNSCTYENPGYDFWGWNAYCPTFDQWLYVSPNGYIRWNYDGMEESGWWKHVLEDEDYIEINGDMTSSTIILYAIWLEI